MKKAKNSQTNFSLHSTFVICVSFLVITMMQILQLTKKTLRFKHGKLGLHLLETIVFKTSAISDVVETPNNETQTGTR